MRKKNLSRNSVKKISENQWFLTHFWPKQQIYIFDFDSNDPWPPRRFQKVPLVPWKNRVAYNLFLFKLLKSIKQKSNYVF